MKNNKLVDELKELREKVCIYEKLQAERNDLIEKLRTAEQRQPHELIDFDRSKKQAFIEEKTGKPPKKPVKILKLAVPVYAAMIKEYEKEYSLYKSRCNDAENEYYNLYSEERMRIDANEREQINNDITRLRQSCDEIELKYHAAKQEVDVTRYWEISIRIQL